jgi:hypothetical protein
MRMRQSIVSACLLSMLLLTATSNLARAGSVTYNVSVNTSSLLGSDGYLDVQFNPGGIGAASATASVTGFTADGTLQPAAPLNGTIGDVTGSLPGALGLTNSTAFNDYFEGMHFGNTITFALTLSGPGVNGVAPDGSSFAFSLFDSSGGTALLTTDPNGSVLTVNVNGDATVSALTFPQSPNDPTPVATATLVSSVPEPSSLALMTCLVPAGLAVWRRSHPR